MTQKYLLFNPIKHEILKNHIDQSGHRGLQYIFLKNSF